MRQFLDRHRLLIVVVALGMLGGLLVGVWVGWMAWPVQVSNVDVADLSPSAQNDYIALAASDYAYDQDLPRAQSRLALLHDSDLVSRLSALAMQYASEGNEAAPQIAALAVALGSTDNAVALIATTATPTPTDTPTPTSTDPPTLTPTQTPTVATETPTRRPRPRVTSTPTSMPISATVWVPAYPSGWPEGVSYQPADVSKLAPGAKYWHLLKAMFCDLKDKHDYCQNLPGGSSQEGVWIMLIGEDGARASAPLSVTRPGATSESPEEKSATDMCDCNYAVPAFGYSFQVAGAPSDAIGGLANPQNYHVRYFLTFQRVTK